MWFWWNRFGNDISPVGGTIEQAGGRVLTHRRVSDLTLDNTGRATGVVCGDEVLDGYLCCWSKRYAEDC